VGGNGEAWANDLGKGGENGEKAGETPTAKGWGGNGDCVRGLWAAAGGTGGSKSKGGHSAVLKKQREGTERANQQTKGGKYESGWGKGVGEKGVELYSKL